MANFKNISSKNSFAMAVSQREERSLRFRIAPDEKSRHLVRATKMIIDFVLTEVLLEWASLVGSWPTFKFG